jgi:hypothetical protein
LICTDGVPTQEKADAMREHISGWLEEMGSRGVRRFGHELAPAGAAVTVRVRDGETVLSDGPFAETKEFVAGFDVVDCADLDEAIEVAAKHPVSWFHSIEVRPFGEYPLDPSGSDPDSGDDRELQAAGKLAGDPAPGSERYLLLFCINGIPEPDDEEETIRRDARDWLAQVVGRGIQVYGHSLGPAETATTVRVRDGERLISDGPFVETKEFLGGFDILDCVSRQEAIDLAASHPLARYHMVEVRPFAREE